MLRAKPSILIYLTEFEANSGLLLDDRDVLATSEPPERFILIPRNELDGSEAPNIHEQDGALYLFVNMGRCCMGVDTTCEVVLGRGPSIDGSYVDADGEDLRGGGGTSFLSSTGRFIGSGHAGIRDTGAGAMVGFHSYDGAHFGGSKLALHTLIWEDGWPVVGDLIVTHDH